MAGWWRAKLDRLADNPWLIGDPSVPGRELGARVRRLSIAAICAANVVGSAVVICFGVWALPKPAGVFDGGVLAANLALAAVYVVFATTIGVVWGRQLLEEGEDGIRGWLEANRPPTPAQRLRVLRGPLRIMGVQAVLWGTAVVCFSALNASFSGLLALGVGLTVALGGLTTSAAAYVLSELALRPVASRALTVGAGERGEAEDDDTAASGERSAAGDAAHSFAAGTADRRGVPGVALRWLLAWALGTGAPIVGLMLVGIVALTDVPIDEATLAITIVVLSAFALGFGVLVSALSAYATVHPISSIQRGLARVQQGDFEVELPVWDSTEMGLLQAGFNDMAAGLRERERIRDVFGRQVGRDVARQALEDPRLGGQLCEVAVLFVDLVGSTTLAATRRPQDVVELLNRFFAEVIDVVERNGGWINKFQGDAALAVFGAPATVEDPQGAALGAARELNERLRAELPELTAGIGVATGPVVAGHVGAESRFEYTVVGDPVNEAARLTELAKSHPARVLASEPTVAAAAEGEARRWETGGSETLRGRTSATLLAYPASR